MKGILKKVAGNWILTINGKVFINPSCKVIVQQMKQTDKDVKVIA